MIPSLLCKANDLSTDWPTYRTYLFAQRRLFQSSILNHDVKSLCRDIDNKHVPLTFHSFLTAASHCRYSPVSIDANTGILTFPHLNQYLTRLTGLFFNTEGHLLPSNAAPPSGPGTALCKVRPWRAVSSKLTPPPPPDGCGSLSTRKQGPYPAPFCRGVWQLIFFCTIRVCNPHFHVGIPLRPVLNPPAVQTGWLIKGILFVKQSLTTPPLSLMPSFTLSSFLVQHSQPLLPHSSFFSNPCGFLLLAFTRSYSLVKLQRTFCDLLAFNQIPPEVRCTLAR